MSSIINFDYKGNEKVEGLIPIGESNGKKAVNARDLHTFLQCTERFQSWFDRQLQFGFIENEDYVGCKVFNALANQELQDYAITIGMAKEISMIQRSELGKQARKYFIACEKIATEKPKLSRKELALMVVEAEEENERLQLANKQKENKIAKLQPKADFADAAFKAVDSKVDIGQAAKILNLGFGRNTLFKKLKEAGIFFCNRNEPKQKYIDAGYFIMTELPPIQRDNHPDIIHMKVLCSQKGLAYINHLFGGKPSDGKLIPIM